MDIKEVKNRRSSLQNEFDVEENVTSLIFCFLHFWKPKQVVGIFTATTCWEISILHGISWIISFKPQLKTIQIQRCSAKLRLRNFIYGKLLSTRTFGHYSLVKFLSGITAKRELSVLLHHLLQEIQFGGISYRTFLFVYFSKNSPVK